MVTVELEDDARPIARVLAQLLRRSAADPELAQVLAGLDGVLGLQSATDPQRATIHFRSGSVYVEGGLNPAAEVVITTDFNAPSGPGAPKPTLKDMAKLARAAARRPVFAQNAAKVLEPPLPDWTEAAASFWQTVERRGGGPVALKVICTDGDTGELTLGADIEEPPEIHGSARNLSRAFAGEDIIGEALVEGRLQGFGRLGTVSLLTGHSLAVMLGG